MPEDIEAILELVQEEVGEDARALLEAALADEDASSLPPDAVEAAAGEMKQRGGDGVASPNDAVTEAELDQAILELREQMATQDDIDQLLEEVQGSAQKALMDALPGLADAVGQKMATGTGQGYGEEIASTFGPGLTRHEAPPAKPAMEGVRRKGAWGAPDVDYADDMAEAHGTGERPDHDVREEHLTDQKMETEEESGAVDYSEAIDAAFGAGG